MIKGAQCDFLRSCWQEFVFVGQSLPAAKSVWEVGATEADWELRATSTPTSTIHHLPPSPSLNAIFFWMFQDIFKVCFHPKTWNLSKILHRRIFRKQILHRQFHLISTVLVKKTQKLSENGEFYTAGINFTVSPALTAVTNLASERKVGRG